MRSRMAIHWLAVLTIALLLLPATGMAEWTVVDAGIGSNLLDLSYPADGQAWASSQNGEVYVTADGGDTWTEQWSMDFANFEGVGFADAQFGTIANMGGAIYFTTDGGQNWDTETEGWMVTFYDAHTIPGTNTSYVAGKNTIFQPFMMYTTDGWDSRQSVAFYPTFNDVGYEGHIRNLTDIEGTTLVAAIGIWDGTGAICMSYDGGQTWDSIIHTGSTIMDVEFADANNGAAVSYDGTVLHSNDGGQTWTEVYTAGAALNSVAFADAETGYAVGDGGTIIETSDGGATWDGSTSPTGNNLRAIDFYGLNGLIVGDAGTVLSNTVAPPPAVLTLTPQGMTIIPSEGGTFQYDVHLVSNLSGTFNLRYWTEVTLPNGQEFGPLMNVPFTMTPFMDQTVTGLSQMIPGYAPSGMYSFTGYAGYMSGPNISSSFNFTKVAGGADNVAFNPEDWAATGSLDQVAGEASDAVEVPEEFAMGKAYPNPFNPSTSISLNLPETAELTVAVFDVTGRQVATIAQGNFSAGSHTLKFDASHLTSGVYFIQANFSGHKSQVQKVTLMK